MIYQQSTLKRHQLLLVTATLACHARVPEKGFRQRDVRWMLEFSANWAYPEFDKGAIPVENTQIRRYLEWLVGEGFARKLTRGDHPRYRLTRLGIVDLISSVTTKGYYYNKEEFFYLYLLVKDYRPRIKAMIEREKSKFPHSIRLELEALLNAKTLVENQLSYARVELQKLEKRINDQQGTAQFVTKALKDGVAFEKVISEVDRRFPFTLNSAKPVSQFLPGLTENQALWELTTGSLKRSEHLWKPASEALELHIEQLQRLLADEEADSIDIEK